MHIKTVLPHSLGLVLRTVTALALTVATILATPSAARGQSAPSIYFRAPRDGAVVGPTFDVAFGLKNTASPPPA